jgi:hypothetical protein
MELPYKMGGLAPLFTPDDLGVAVGALTGLTDWWDFHPDRITGTTEKIIANRVGGRGPLTELSAFSGLVLNASNLPPGGMMRQSALFADNAVLQMSDAFPTGAVCFTQVMIYRPSPIAALAALPAGELARPQAGNSQIHRIFMLASHITVRVGSAGSFKDAEGRHAIGAWNWLVAQTDLVTGSKSVTIQVNGDTPVVTAVTTQNNAQSTHYIGGDQTVASLQARIGAILHFTGSGDAGRLFAASRAADLALVHDFCRSMIGRLQVPV